MILQRKFEDLFGTHGEMLDNFNMPTGVYTLEQPWRDNKADQSCIPVGDYVCKSHNSIHFQGVWQVMNVPDRLAILIHAGNTIKDTHGCILVGLFRTKQGVGSSQDALTWLRTHVPSEFRLRIRGIGEESSEAFL